MPSPFSAHVHVEMLFIGHTCWVCGASSLPKCYIFTQLLDELMPKVKLCVTFLVTLVELFLYSIQALMRAESRKKKNKYFQLFMLGLPALYVLLS
jgi:hypothetical protein